MSVRLNIKITKNGILQLIKNSWFLWFIFKTPCWRFFLKQIGRHALIPIQHFPFFEKKKKIHKFWSKRSIRSQGHAKNMKPDDMVWFYWFLRINKDKILSFFGKKFLKCSLFLHHLPLDIIVLWYQHQTLMKSNWQTDYCWYLNCLLSF